MATKELTEAEKQQARLKLAKKNRDDAQTQVYEAMERRDASEVQWGKRALVLRKRYRRTDDKEIAENARVQKMKERLDEIAAASAAALSPEALQAVYEQKAAAEAKMHDEDVKAKEAARDKAQQILDQVEQGLTFEQIEQKTKNLQDQHKALDLEAQKAKAEGEARWREAEAKKTMAERKDRPMSELKSDIELVDFWIVLFGENKSSHKLQEIEYTQNTPTCKEHKAWQPVKDVFLYSKSRGCAVHITQMPVVAGQAIKWTYKRYYEPAPYETVKQVFRSLNTQDFEQLPKNVKIDESAFVDVEERVAL